MHLFDILLFALVAIFLVLRLRSVLGSRDGHEGGYFDRFNRNPDDEGRQGSRPASGDDNVVRLPGATDDDAQVPALPGANEAFGYAGPVADGIRQIRAQDKSFLPKEFLAGARMAFEMILNAYAAGDLKTLKSLLSADVYAGFAKAIEDRGASGQTLQETLVGITVAELAEVYMDGRDAHVTVKFVSEQISALLDADGKVVEGDPAKVVTATDFWTFSRATKSRNPNWTLVGTGALT